MTLVTTSRLQADANAPQISLTDEEYICFMTIESSANTNVANITNDAKKTPVKEAKKGSEKTPKKDSAAGGMDSSSTSSMDSDTGMFSDDDDEQPAKSGGFQGWSDDDVEADECDAMANIIT